MFSGAATRQETFLSEASSYLSLCVDNDFWGLLPAEGKSERIAAISLEEQALDSFSNLLFSIVRFWHSTHTWPEKITIVSQGFKKNRFLGCHVKAIRWPIERIAFTGATPWSVDAVRWDEERVDEIKKAEYRNVSKS